METPNLARIAAPMVNQSDLPFRLLVRKYGATATYTQMLIPDKILNDRDYLEFHQRDLELASNAPEGPPTIVQVCGNDTEQVVQAAKRIQTLCQGIDLNLGCPQDAAREGHYGAYLLSQKDWPLVNDIVSSLSHSLTIPVSAKLRLCQPSTKTLDLGSALQASGASWITLHPRTVSARRRRQGAADLKVVRTLKASLTIPVISNGNVRHWDDIPKNLVFTGADGVMVDAELAMTLVSTASLRRLCLILSPYLASTSTSVEVIPGQRL
ncbi:tRNA-dihydrouridine synthase [Schizophyllum commune]